MNNKKIITSATGRFSRSGLTQLMVFLNGLILTGTAFATLTVFISQMREEDNKALVLSTEASVDDSFKGIDENLSVMEAVIASASISSDGQAMLNGLSRIPLKSYYSSMSLYERAANGQWQTRTLFQSQQPDQNIFKGLQVTVPELTDLISKVPANAGTVFTPQATENALVYADTKSGLGVQPIRVMRIIRVAGAPNVVLIGFTDLGKVLERSGIKNNPKVKRLIVRDNMSGNRLLQMERQKTGRAETTTLPLTLSSDSWQKNYNGLDLEFEIQIEENLRMAFISRVPSLLLLFGLTLTLIGTLYVRNNNRQSIRLSAMNLALSSKNIELKNHIEEGHNLYAALQRSEKEYRAVIDAVSDIIFETDSLGQIVFLNETWQRITGYDVSRSIGRDLFDMLHPAEIETQRAGFNAFVKNKGKAYRSITRLHTMTGKVRAVELAFSMVRTDNSKNTRVVGTITDVDERRRAEKALAEAEKKYRTIVENAAGGIYQVRPDGGLLSANLAFARILGYQSPAQLNGEVEDMATLYADPRDRLRYERDLETFGYIRGFEIQMKHRDGQLIWVSENARCVRDEDGNLLYYEGSMEEITQRKIAESELKAAKRESDIANRAKSEFLANMSHELRTPLNAIIGFSEIIKTESMGPVGQPVYADYAADIHESGNRLLSVINDILDISRIESGNKTLNESVFSLSKVSEACLSLMSSKAIEARINLQSHVADTLPLMLGEELAFKQMLMNLISNAIKFSSQGAVVNISADYAGAGSDLKLSVSDTGVGMDEHELAIAMAPFGQLESAFSRSHSGTGLGLTLVDSLIKLHGGHFELVSRKGVGTTATLVIPAQRIMEAQGAPLVFQKSS